MMKIDRDLNPGFGVVQKKRFANGLSPCPMVNP